MNVMGRPKTVNLDLPPRMAARKLASGKVLFYYQQGRTKVPLGPDLAKARVRWAELENGPLAVSAFKNIAERYRKEWLPKNVYSTRKHKDRIIDVLIAAFGAIPMAGIKPHLVRKYLDERTHKIAANREKAVLSHIFNWAREVGIIDIANPCAGVKRNREVARGVYVTDEDFAATRAQAPVWLQDAMDLALLTGQRPADLFKMQRSDIRDGHLWVTQNKTGAKLGIKVEGELKDVLEGITSRSGTVSSVYLIRDARGQRITPNRLKQAFRKVRVGNWQFRDIRAKTATDSGDIRKAQHLLGHSRETTTAAVYRRTKGNLVAPLARKLRTD